MPRPPRIGGATAAATLCINLLALALPLTLLQVFDRVVPNSALETLAVLLAGLGVCILLDLVLKICRITLLGASGEAYELALDEAILRRFLEAEPRAFADGGAGVRLEQAAAVAQLRDHYGGQGRLLALDMPFAAVFVAMIWVIGGALALAPVACIAALTLVAVLLRRAQAPALAARDSIDRRRWSFVIESLAQIETLKVFGMEPQMRRRYERLQAQSESASRRLIWASATSRAAAALVGQAGTAAMAAWGGWLAIHGHLGIAEIAACMLLNGRAMQPMSRALGIWVQRGHLHAAKARIAEAEALAPADPAPMMLQRGRGAGRAAVRPPAAPQAALRGAISLRGVAAGPPGGLRPVFQDVDAEVPPGGCMALLGPDGAGKSLMMSLLMGEMGPRAGTVRLDGRDPREFAARLGRRGGVAYLDSKPPLFEGSLLDNLSMFGDGAARDAAVASAWRIGLAEEIERLPQGFDTPAMRQGRAIGTQGFAQRLGAARALALAPRLLLFDEANTALDIAADRRLLAALTAMKGETTLVLASRRPSYLRLADLRIDLAGHAPGAAVSVQARAAWSADLAAELSESLHLRDGAADEESGAVPAKAERNGPAPQVQNGEGAAGGGRASRRGAA